MHAAFDADASVVEGREEQVVGHEVAAGAETVAVDAVAEVVPDAVEFVF